MLGAIGRAIDRAIAVVADTTVFRTARQYDVQRPIRASSQSPGEGLILRDSLILQGPALSAVGALVYAASKRCHVKHTGIRRAGGIEQNMSRGRLFHSAARLGPGLSPIIAAAYTTFVCGDGIVPPHFGTGQVVGIAVHAPGAAAHFGIKHHPVSRIHPFAGNSGGGTRPRNSVIFAAEESDICVGNELPFRIERIEMDSVSICDIQPSGCPSIGRSFARIDSVPVRASVRRLHGSSEIGSIGKIRVLVCYCQIQRVFTPDDSEALRNPSVVHIGRGGVRFFPYQLPVSASVSGFGHTQPLFSIQLQMAVGEISGFRMAQTGCDGAKLPTISGKTQFLPCRAAIF